MRFKAGSKLALERGGWALGFRDVGSMRRISGCVVNVEFLMRVAGLRKARQLRVDELRRLEGCLFGLRFMFADQISDLLRRI